MTRYPSTPDCSIKGCTRAVHKMGVCRKHYDLVPFSLAMDKMRAIWAATFRINRMYERKARKAVLEALKAQSEQAKAA